MADKLFTIKKNTVSKSKLKFPYKIYLNNGRVIPTPNHHRFTTSYIKLHGCSLDTFYMALRFLGINKTMGECKKYLDANYGLGGHSKYSLIQISKAINKIASKNYATFYKKATSKQINEALKNGDMVLFEERDPIHSVVLLYNGVKVKRFSSGTYKNITVSQEVKKRCGDSYYGGCVFVKRR